jgi:hypothetical protein
LSNSQLFPDVNKFFNRIWGKSRAPPKVLAKSRFWPYVQAFLSDANACQTSVPYATARDLPLKVHVMLTNGCISVVNSWLKAFHMQLRNAAKR